MKGNSNQMNLSNACERKDVYMSSNKKEICQYPKVPIKEMLQKQNEFQNVYCHSIISKEYTKDNQFQDSVLDDVLNQFKKNPTLNTECSSDFWTSAKTAQRGKENINNSNKKMMEDETVNYYDFYDNFGNSYKSKKPNCNKHYSSKLMQDYKNSKWYEEDKATNMDSFSSYKNPFLNDKKFEEQKISSPNFITTEPLSSKKGDKMKMELDKIFNDQAIDVINEEEEDSKSDCQMVIPLEKQNDEKLIEFYKSLLNTFLSTKQVLNYNVRNNMIINDIKEISDNDYRKNPVSQPKPNINHPKKEEGNQEVNPSEKVQNEETKQKETIKQEVQKEAEKAENPKEEKKEEGKKEEKKSSTKMTISKDGKMVFKKANPVKGVGDDFETFSDKEIKEVYTIIEIIILKFI